MARPLIAAINLAALRHNYQLALGQSATGTAVAVVKADAYGHGAIPVARTLSDLAPAFGVACIEEAEQLRTAGIQQPILLLEGFFEAEEIPQLLQQQYQPVLHSQWQIDQLTSHLQQHPVKPGSLNVWLKVDTGMHRLGLAPEAVTAAWQTLRQLPAIGEMTLVTHFARADETNCPVTEQQITRFQALQQQLQCPASLANSAATLHWQAAQQGWLRPGIMLYGASPLVTGHPLGEQLQPVMTLESRLISVRDLPAGEAVGYGGRFVTSQATRIGVIACGYGDGYPRQARDGTPILVNGRRCSLAGRVSMDMMTVDLGPGSSDQPGDPVELWGNNLSVNEVADWCDTISYTLLTGLLPRVRRIYSGE
ncbi:alanine racemase [Marinospirillum alkaliphilum]|uniref:Alanine racemase n=1 Tax=Marinospirillum alkaliphilum DSM 21637 TaxID=1122209 RepID=A0A1K1XL69_9GAMM|nr:alanine racemase [Marinospirillum alkaliphilum]SFX50131.1 alanine racemase [Marinospirillum alkaliphilum DSM 21637]